MVLEQYFKVKWIERKEHAFFLGFVYSLIGIVSARLIFPSSVGIMSIAFASILMVPSLSVLLKLEENAEIREKKFSIRMLIHDHKDIFKVYIFLFLGIFLAYSLVALISSNLSIQKMFSTQLKSVGIKGFAFFDNPWISIVMNNLLVMVVCFVLSIVYGAGSVLFLTWNASVWGVAFAYFVKQQYPQGANVFIGFSKSFLPFLPHMMTEAIAYISAAIVGGIVSKAVLREKLFSKKFHHIITDAIILMAVAFLLVIIAGFIEVNFYWNVS